jgi:DNA-binding MarR family transcriptional regulator
MRAAATTEILDQIRRIVRTLREASRAAERKVGVSGAQLFVMKALAAEESLSLNQLAERTHTHQSTVSSVVKRLVQAGVVRRRSAAEDGRRLELTLTPAGRAILKRAPLAGQERLIEGIHQMSVRDTEALARLLRRLVKAMGIVAAEPIMLFEEPLQGNKSHGA